MNTVVKKQTKLPYYINLLLVIALGISAAKLMWLILSPTPEINSNPLPVTALNSVVTPQNTQPNYGKLIAKQHLFGEIKKQATVNTTPIQQPIKAATPVKLNLKLHGIVAYTNRKGFALISSNGGEQKVYGKGDEIEDKVVVTKLYPEKVVINNNGIIEELILPRNKQKGGTRSLPASNLNRSSLSGGNPRINHPSAMSPPTSPSAPNFGKFRKEVLKDPKKLLDVATPSPAVDDDGEFIGFRVQPSSNRKIFRQIGLRANDVITSVNGIILDDASKGPMVLGELTQASSISITVLRGDEELTLSHTF